MRLKQREIWKTILDFPDYAISNYGRVKRVTPIKSGNGIRKGTILKLHKNMYGYIRAILFKDKKKKYLTIHKLVLGTFIGSCPNGKECNHKDGDKTNNKLSNLEWVTSSENTIHSFKNNLQIPIKGGKHWRSKLKSKELNMTQKIRKLKEGEVWLIKKLLSKGISSVLISKMFKVTHSNINYIKLNKTWKHITIQ